MLDPSCGDGRFLSLHRNSTGVEQDEVAAKIAMRRAPWAAIHEGDFFSWAGQTPERFDAAAGNPPFIRYQRFTGKSRAQALSLCTRLGADFSSLTSSWAPFLLATASLLRPGGRMAFVVPSEIGHAPYAVPLLKYLAASFGDVRIIAIRKKIFPELNEDCWLLYAEGFGRSTKKFRLTALPVFRPTDAPPSSSIEIHLNDWQTWNYRLRPFLLPQACREFYRSVCTFPLSKTLSEVARVGIGYVTGANEFFHLRPSTAREFGLPDQLLHPSVRNGRALGKDGVGLATVRRWLLNDEPVLLLRLKKDQPLNAPLQRYLDTDEARKARETYKCRMRDPWYVVPDMTVPDAFLSYMSGSGVSLSANHAACVGTNSVHVIRLNGEMSLSTLQRRWKDPISQLSCEIEGHPLGGGMLKLEPREAGRVILAARPPSLADDRMIFAGITEMQQWRHYD